MSADAIINELHRIQHPEAVMYKISPAVFKEILHQLQTLNRDLHNLRDNNRPAPATACGHSLFTSGEAEVHFSEYYEDCPLCSLDGYKTAHRLAMKELIERDQQYLAEIERREKAEKAIDQSVK